MSIWCTLYAPTGGVNTGAKFDPTSGGIEAGGGKLDASDFVAPAGGVKFADERPRARRSKLTPSI